VDRGWERGETNAKGKIELRGESENIIIKRIYISDGIPGVVVLSVLGVSTRRYMCIRRESKVYNNNTIK